MPCVTDTFGLPVPDPGPWEAYLANNVRYNQDPTDQANIARVRELWTAQRDAAARGATSYCYGEKTTGTRVSARLTAGKTQVAPAQYVKTPISTVTSKQTTSAKLPVATPQVAQTTAVPAASNLATVSPEPRNLALKNSPALIHHIPMGVPIMSGSLSSLGSLLVGTAVGGPVGGIMGGIGSVLPTLGGSKCPGPYNWDAQTGTCVPKPDYWARVGGGSPGTSTSPCPTGYEWDGKQCIQSGMGGSVARILPGGSSGYATDVYGEAMMGRYGPALVPYTASVPTRRCPTGSVLGDDGLCYNKGTRGLRRMHKKPTPPLLTGGERNVLRKAKRLENQVKKAWQAAGSPGKPKPCSSRRKR